MAVRGLMRKDETDEALKTVLLFDFYSKDAPNREEGNLFDMQVATELVAFLFARRRTGVWLWRCYEKRQGAAVELSHTRSEYPLPRVRAFFRPAPRSRLGGDVGGVLHRLELQAPGRVGESPQEVTADSSALDRFSRPSWRRV